MTTILEGQVGIFARRLLVTLICKSSVLLFLVKRIRSGLSEDWSLVLPSLMQVKKLVVLGL